MNKMIFILLFLVINGCVHQQHRDFITINDPYKNRKFYVADITSLPKSNMGIKYMGSTEKYHLLQCRISKIHYDWEYFAITKNQCDISNERRPKEEFEYIKSKSNGYWLWRDIKLSNGKCSICGNTES